MRLFQSKYQTILIPRPMITNSYEISRVSNFMKEKNMAFLSRIAKSSTLSRSRAIIDPIEHSSSVIYIWR